MPQRIKWNKTLEEKLRLFLQDMVVDNFDDVEEDDEDYGIWKELAGDFLIRENWSKILKQLQLIWDPETILDLMIKFFTFWEKKGRKT